MQLDDLIIMGDTKEELEQNIRLILARLDKYELKIAIHKCDFDCNSSIEFLGHTICDGKISPGPKSSKILEGIVFIGIANWFAKYIPDCQRRLRPLLDARIDGWHDASKDGYFCVLFEDTGIGDAGLVDPPERDACRLPSAPGVLNILPDAGSRLLHLQHPNFVDSQFQSMASLLEALLVKQQLDNLLAQFAGCGADAACDDTSIGSLNSSHTCSSVASLDWATRQFPNGSGSCSTVNLQHGPGSCSTVNLSTSTSSGNVMVAALVTMDGTKPFASFKALATVGPPASSTSHDTSPL